MQDSQNLSFPICQIEMKLSFCQGCHEAEMRINDIKWPHTEQLLGKGPSCL